MSGRAQCLPSRAGAGGSDDAVRTGAGTPSALSIRVQNRPRRWPAERPQCAAPLAAFDQAHDGAFTDKPGSRLWPAWRCPALGTGVPRLWRGTACHPRLRRSWPPPQATRNTEQDPHRPGNIALEGLALPLLLHGGGDSLCSLPAAEQGLAPVRRSSPYARTAPGLRHGRSP